MTRLLDIRERAEADRELHWLKLRETQDDVFFLLDLVERAVPWVKAATLLRGFRVEDAEQWLLGVRGK